MVEVDILWFLLFVLFDFEVVYLSWIFFFEIGVFQSLIYEVFEFVEDDCDFLIEQMWVVVEIVFVIVIEKVVDILFIVVVSVEFVVVVVFMLI